MLCLCIHAAGLQDGCRHVTPSQGTWRRHIKVQLVGPAAPCLRAAEKKLSISGSRFLLYEWRVGADHSAELVHKERGVFSISLKDHKVSVTTVLTLQVEYKCSHRVHAVSSSDFLYSHWPWVKCESKSVCQPWTQQYSLGSCESAGV